MLRRKSASSTSDAASVPAEAAQDPELPAADGGASEAIPPAQAGKGRPTPKRRESERRRGPVAPPPMTQREAYKRAKESGGRVKLTKEDRKALVAERRERMMRGDEAHVLPRDRGEVRAYVRDVVDARRNLAGLLLPIALLSFITLIIPSPVITAYGPMLLMVAILAAVTDSVIFGRRLSRMVHAKFPNGDKSGNSTKGASLGFYAFNRATLIRRWRIPRPRVDRGDVID